MSLYKKKGIYCIRNIVNNKRYIGSTYLSFGDRRDVHFAMLRNGKHHSKLLQDDYNKYGENNFLFEIIEEVYSDISDDYYNREKFYIEKFDSFNSGYNKTLGGLGSKGTTTSIEKRNILSEINRKRMTGTILCKETRNKMKASRENNKNRTYGNGSILTKEQVVDIKNMLISGKRVADIAETYNVTTSCISSINKNRNWKSVEVDGWKEYLERNR